MEFIDFAADKFSSLLAEISGYKDTITTEQDTRLKVLNRVLTDVLGWTLSNIFTEEYSGGGYLDYKLSVDGFARLVVEAKRDGRELGLTNRATGRAYKLNGAVFNADAVREGIGQAIRYCGQKNAELACVTNGHEWVIFRGSRLGDGKDTTEGMAFVFPSLESIQSNFALFYDLISYEAVSEFRYRAFFQEAEGRPIRSQVFRRSLRSPNSRRLVPHDNLSTDIERVMSSFFRRLSGDDDPEMLAQCFVVSRESEAADERLARISEDLASKIRDLDTSSGEQLTEVVERVRATHKNEFVIIVGTKGAGKSTFIDRFFRYVLPEPVLEDCIVAKVNLADSEGDEGTITTWLDYRLLAELERAIFKELSPTYDELQGMFFDEYQRWSTGTFRHLYEKDKEEFKIEFGRHLEKRREERPHEYIQKLVRHIVKSRIKVPCLVFDNADHFTIEFQERIFQYARSIYESELCLIIMPITDRTSWQLSREGALRSFESETLFLPTPSPQIVLQRRIEFIENRLSDERRESGRGYFFGRGISLTIDNLTGFTAALQAIFLRTGEVSWWIGNLANRDIRRCLEIAKFLVSSPHLKVHELVKTHIAESSIVLPGYKIKRALLKGQYDIYPTGIHPFVLNVYTLEEDVETSPLLGLRILRMLRDAQKSGADDPFITLDQIVEYFRAMLVEPTVTLAWLSRLLDHGLCLSYDPTVTDITAAAKIELSPSGFQQLRWGTRDGDYARIMMTVTPLLDSVTFERLNELQKRPTGEVWRAELETFVDYLIGEDSKYCKIPKHDAYATQERLPRELGGMIRGR